MERINVAVIGLGPAGLTALKSLREEGFNAIAFERRDKIGGLWSLSSDTTFTSVWDETVSNVCKFVTGFSDFPVPKDWPTYPTSSQAAEYFGSYASHFDLYRHVRFNTTVRRVTRNTSDSAWELHITNSDGYSVLSFDKVAFGHGCDSVPVWPPMPNRDTFKGIVIHGQAYRDPAPFKGKKVLVVGIGNTACEVSLSLCKHTSKLYQSYRRGRVLLTRSHDPEDGVPFESRFSWPDVRLKYFLDYTAPWLLRPLMNKFLMNNMISIAARSEPVQPGVSPIERQDRAERRMRNDWRLLPCASMAHVHPIVQEDFIPALRRGDITPLHGFQDFVGEKQILLADNTVVEVDAVIFCTGYTLDFSIMPELEMNGACGIPLQTAEEVSREQAIHNDEGNVNSHDRQRTPIPRLFQMVFPPRWASSIAVLSWVAPQEPVWSVSELTSMAVAQIWAAETAKSLGLQVQPGEHRSPALLPSLSEMNDQVDAYHMWFRKEWEKDHSMCQGYVQAYSFYRFLHDAAGTGLYENLDHIFTGRGWRLWWKDPDLWTWLAKGPMTSYSWRLFETNPQGIPGCGRKAWPKARNTLKEAYQSYEDYKRQMQHDSKNK